MATTGAESPEARIGVGGMAFLARGLTNLELRRLIGIAAGRRAIALQKAITVDAPVATVFDFWDCYENFSRFMPHVHEVRKTDGNRSHWDVAGPASTLFEWDAETTG